MSDKLILRLSSLEQYAVNQNKESLLQILNEIDNQIVHLLMDTESQIQSLLIRMERLVKDRGIDVTDELIDLDRILPPTDLDLSEAIKIFEGEGILPG